MKLVNKTPFVTERVVLQDNVERDLLVAIVKCTYSLNDLTRLEPAEEQAPIQMEDDFYGEPGESSVRYESDLVPKKTGTDVVLLGHAYAPGRVGRQVDVSLRVGHLKQMVRVFGDRHWKKIMGFSGISTPEPFEKIPLIYERAFGGKDTSSSKEKHHDCETRNPVGRGFLAKKSKLKIKEVLLPNIEDPTNLIGDLHDHPAPAGFGFIGRHWQPRVGYAGTYDQKWTDTTCPLLPEDFDERYFNGAHPRLIGKGFLQGNEPVEVINASSKGLLRFSLPGESPTVSVTMGKEQVRLEMSFDTLIIEPDENRIVMIWRGSSDIHNRMYQVKNVEVTTHA